MKYSLCCAITLFYLHDKTLPTVVIPDCRLRASNFNFYLVERSYESESDGLPGLDPGCSVWDEHKRTSYCLRNTGMSVFYHLCLLSLILPWL
jgi:hypothetical protein